MNNQDLNRLEQQWSPGRAVDLQPCRDCGAFGATERWVERVGMSLRCRPCSDIKLARIRTGGVGE